MIYLAMPVPTSTQLKYISVGSFARTTGTPFIANPDLVSRFALGGDLAGSDRSTHYLGGPRGYADYPMWAPSETRR